MNNVVASKIRTCFVVAMVCTVSLSAFATAKPHVVNFGKWTTVQWSAESGAPDEKSLPLKVRALMMDSRLKEFTFGPVHEVTDRLFVVRRAFRVNDSLPDESAATPHWQWQRGGWLLADRVSGRVSPLNLPEFDPVFSNASWYRDYASYCGISDDGKKVYAVVAQVSRRKPVLKQIFEERKIDVKSEIEGAIPESNCNVLMWQRAPARVTFTNAASSKVTFLVRGHVVDLISEGDENEEALK